MQARFSLPAAALTAAALVLAGCASDDDDDTPADGNGPDAAPTAGQPDADLEFPTGTVRIVVGSGPGSTMDTMARGLAPRLQELWGESVVVDNVPGANQSAGYHEVAGADPDGHTLFISVHGTMGIHDQLGTIDPGWQEFEWFGTLLEEPWTFYSAADGSIETLDDLLAEDVIRYGDSGYESPINPVALTFFEAFGKDFIFTPGYDPGDAQQSVLTGEQHIVGRDAAQMLRGGIDGDFRALLVFSHEPNEFQPEAMTLADVEDEYGVSIPDMEIFQLGFPIGTTPGTPPEIVDFLADSIVTLIEEDEPFQQWIQDNHMVGSVRSELIGRETTQQKVAAVTEQYAEFGMDGIQQRLEAGTVD
ncbi:Bug family tripartite tricarboxylate transporter substrate binding protein [Phytoactinopolyspora limicola]|uniref:Bug family tripartite tricarboxylate transporter substrate binding protein n=1 Tax=Phytoactinopolyspora limicola TaxID=2715536 RepID=UPI00140BA0E4|nr:tripartite tricarboxylate transporter substrate-binding protein [Phytoactinopolyspora limicola]